MPFFPPRLLGCCSPWLVLVLLATAAAQSRTDESSSSPYGIAGDLAELVGAYLRHLPQKEAVLKAQMASFAQEVAVAGEAVVAAFNVCSQCLLATLRLQDFVPLTQASAEGVVFVCQCLLLSLICYGVIWLLIRWLACMLHFGFWLLKVAGGLASFVFILSDRSVPMEVTKIRLAVLMLLCVLLVVEPWRGRARDDKTVQLEILSRVKTLERMVRGMEKPKKSDGGKRVMEGRGF